MNRDKLGGAVMQLRTGFSQPNPKVQFGMVIIMILMTIGLEKAE